MSLSSNQTTFDRYGHATIKSADKTADFPNNFDAIQVNEFEAKKSSSPTTREFDKPPLLKQSKKTLATQGFKL